MRKGDISHRGRIVEITPEFTTVEIVSTSACSECHAKGLCGVSEEKVKAIAVPTDGFADRNVGDEVDVCLRRVMGHKAVWLSYVIPVFILLIFILTLCSVIGNEVVAGLVSIGAVCLYYLVLWLLRDRLRKEYVFYIK